MAIATAVQRGLSVTVYDEKGQQLFSMPAGTGPNDGLKGYTGKSVSIQINRTIRTYDEKGNQIGSTMV